MNLSLRELSIVGASLYICEGAKVRIDNRGYKQYAIDFTNNNPQVVTVFLRFLREVVHADENRIKGQLFIYPDHNQLKMIKFWSEVTKIPVYQFNKVIHLKQRSGRFKPSAYGTFKLRYHHKEHFLKIQDIINELFEVL